jgi:hypothetical protein
MAIKRKSVKSTRHHHSRHTWNLIVVIGSLAGVLCLITLLIIGYRHKDARGLIPKKLAPYNASAIESMEYTAKPEGLNDPYDVVSGLVSSQPHLTNAPITSTTFAWMDTASNPPKAYVVDGYAVQADAPVGASSPQGYSHNMYFISRGFKLEVGAGDQAGSPFANTAWSNGSVVCLVEEMGRTIRTSCGSRNSFRL